MSSKDSLSQDNLDLIPISATHSVTEYSGTSSRISRKKSSSSIKKSSAGSKTNNKHVSPTKPRGTIIMSKKSSNKYRLSSKLIDDGVDRSTANTQYTHPYFTLPESVRVKILRYLTHTERLLLQFSCRRFRNDIRLRAGLRTKLTEETAQGIAFLRDVLVTSITIGKFDRPISAPSKLIYNPENVTELIFEEAVSIQHLDAFLNRCRKLKWIAIHNNVLDTSVFPLNVKTPYAGYEWRSMEMIQKFPIAQIHLKEINLAIPGPGLRTVNRCLTTFNTPNLERFTLVVKEPLIFDDTTGIHFAVLGFLKNCFGTMTHIVIDTLQRPGTIKYGTLSRAGNAQLERDVSQVVEKKLKLRQLTLTESAVNFETWNMILNHQDHLEVWQVLHMTIWPLLRDIVMINSKTLVKVALHAILWDKHGKHNPVDLTAFNRVVNLKEMYICVAPPAAEGLVDFVSFHKLPKNVEVIALNHCHVNVRDFLSVRNLTQLKYLGIVSVGSLDGNYIGIKTLRKLVHMRNLEELFVSGLMGEGKDVEELKNLINQMKARVKDKRRMKNTFHSFDPATKRFGCRGLRNDSTRPFNYLI